MRSEKIEALRAWVSEAAARLAPALAGVPVELELPRDPSHGDLATNLALRESRRAGLAPRELAARIAGSGAPPAELVSRVEVEGPGFINFHWSAECLRDELAFILASGDAYGREPEGSRGRAQLEFVSANPTGPLNVVSARAAAVGDSLARLMRYRGWHVETEFYVNDAGSQVAGLGASVRALFEEKTGGAAAPEDLPYRGDYVGDIAGEILAWVDAIALAGDERAITARMEEFLGAYSGEADGPPPSDLRERMGLVTAADGAPPVSGAHPAPAPGPTPALRDRLLALVRERLDFAAYAVASNLETQRRDLELLEVRYDADTRRPVRGWFRESWLRREGAVLRTEREYEERGCVREAEGARWLTTSAAGDTEDRVIRRSSGESTYFLADLAYHLDKRARGYDRVIDIWGPDHHGHVARMHAALALYGLPKEWLTVLIAQQVNLLRDGAPVKMSKRAGEFVTLRELVGEVGRDVARFYFLMRRTSSPLDFDIAVATRESEENPIFYVEYAYARIRSIYEVAAGRGVNVAAAIAGAPLDALGEPEELELMKALGRLPAVAETCVRVLDPQGMGTYLRELAQIFHRFYHKHRVLVEEEPLMRARLALTEGVRVVLGDGLRTIGVEPPSGRMTREGAGS